MTGRLWPTLEGLVKLARQPARRKAGEQHRQLHWVGYADCVFSECRHALAIASASLPKAAGSEVVLGRPPFGQPPSRPGATGDPGGITNLVETAWRPRVPGVGGRSRGNPRPAPGGADMECLHAMRTLRACGGTPG